MKRVSLVLGSGGARGFVQIGVIDWLVENGYDIVSISGCSIGAMIGGVFAAGKMEEFKSWVFELEKSDVLRLTDLHFGSGGFVKGDRVMNSLRELVGECAIEDLKVRFTAVATDLNKGKEVWFQEGDLFDAIRASVAVPNVMSPHVIGTKLYVDGGLLNPVPIAPTLGDHTDLTIAVDLAGKQPMPSDFKKKEVRKTTSDRKGKIAKFIEELWSGDDAPVELPSVLDVSNRSFDIMQTVIARTKLATHSPDVLVEFSRDLAAMHEFWRAEELANIGYDTMANVMSEFENNNA